MVEKLDRDGITFLGAVGAVDAGPSITKRGESKSWSQELTTLCRKVVVSRILSMMDFQTSRRPEDWKRKPLAHGTGVDISCSKFWCRCEACMRAQDTVDPISCAANGSRACLGLAEPGAARSATGSNLPQVATPVDRADATS